MVVASKECIPLDFVSQPADKTLHQSPPRGQDVVAAEDDLAWRPTTVVKFLLLSLGKDKDPYKWNEIPEPVAELAE